MGVFLQARRIAHNTFMSLNSSQRSKQDNDILFKGIICALIGAIILLAPYFSRAPDVVEMMRQAYIVGWFALALGIAFLVQFAVRRSKRRANQATIESYKEQNSKNNKKSDRKR